MILLSGYEPFVEMAPGHVNFPMKRFLRSFTLCSGLTYLLHIVPRPLILLGAHKNVLISLKVRTKSELLG